VRSEEVLLRGGARVEAPVVKKGGRAVVVDLGHDLLRLPTEEVLRVLERTGTVSRVVSGRLYAVARGERTSTAEAAARNAPAVVVIRSPAGLGSGFFLSEKGHLITNFHVIRGQKRLSVTRFVRREGALERVVHDKVKILATAPFYDLAVLQLEDLQEKAPFVVLAPTDSAVVGETVFAIGNPLGLERTVTEGVVSQTERPFGGILYLQIDAPINPGNSGGPLFNNRGQVVGIINMKVPSMEGLNFAIPVVHAKYVLDHLDAFAYDQSNPTSGYVYPAPPRNPKVASSEKSEGAGAAGEEKPK